MRQANAAHTATVGYQTDERITPWDLGIGSMFDRMNEAALVIKISTGCIMHWNRAATEIFGYSREEAEQSSLDIIVPPTHREHHHDSVMRYRETGVAHYVDQDRVADLPAVHKDGSTLRIAMKLSSLYTAKDPEETYIVAVIRDVTESKRLEAIAVAMLKAYEERHSDDPHNPLLNSHHFINPVKEGLSVHTGPRRPLTARELEVLSLARLGLKNEDIAERLYLSLSTVKHHLAKINSKLQTANRSEASIRAYEWGLFDDE